MKQAWVVAMAAVALFGAGCMAGLPKSDPIRKPPQDSPQDPCAVGGSTGASAPMEPPPIEDGPVVSPAHPPPPVSGGTLAVLSDGSFVAADPDRDVVWLVGSDRSTIRKVTLGAGDEPGRVVEGPAGHVFVALRGSGEVAQLDAVNASVVERRAVCGAPRGLAWIASDSTLAVACATGTLARLSYAQGSNGAWTFQSMERQSPASDLRDVVWIGGALFVTTFREGRLFVVDRVGKPTELQLPAPIRGEGNFPDAGLVVQTPLARGVAWRMAAGPTGPLISHQWSSLEPIAAKTGSCGSGEEFTQYGTGLLGEPLVRGGVTTWVSGAPEESRVQLPALPVDIAAGSNSTWAVATPTLLHVQSLGAATTIDGIGEPTSVIWSGNTVVAFSREPAMLVFWTDPFSGRAFSTLNLPAESRRSTAHELFHRVTSSQLSCASCHPEGGDDGRVWLLPEGSRRTPSLRGGIAGTAPFHWSGDLDGMKSLMDEVMVKRMGGFIQTQARTDALLAWLDGQKAMRSPDNVDLSAATRGRALFESSAVGCVTCHSGAQGTNNANANVGTGESLQVPRLTELGTRAPYFHDGRIGRLEDRFTAGAGGDLHGHVSQLSAGEIDDLVAYLKTR
jgi:hypothetical protein